jgi:hypothetical protein
MPRQTQHVCTVVGAGKTGNQVRVKFDGSRTAQTLHRSYLEEIVQYGRSLKSDQKAGKTAPHCHSEHESYRPALVACSAAARTGFRSVELLERKLSPKASVRNAYSRTIGCATVALAGQIAAMCPLTDRCVT